ncbi:MAG: tRNA (adenosine(37)-N6)-threonylcarbamoyltransferase complex ATPase subunit type 1 TsaE [Pseudomonadota bacterium]
MITAPFVQHWQTEQSTVRAATALGHLLALGDAVLLTGDVGTGKTHFARALIQSILFVPEDVPSPTFTLVQVYDTVQGPLWHADLYRVSTAMEVDELGLTEAFEDAICLIEWPDRLGPLAPSEALCLDIQMAKDGRRATFNWTDPKWARRLENMAAHV